MRISTATLYDSGTRAILDRQETLAATQLQLATGRRVVLPSDDPAAASQVVSLSSIDARVAQYQKNLQVARGRLALTEATLGSIGTVLQRVRELALSAGNGTLDDGARRAIAAEVQSQLGTLLGLANSSDPSTGGYLFAGDATDVRPFARSGGTVVYAGDQGHLDVPVSDTLELRSTVNGDEVFARVPSGNGTFATAATATNAGSALIDAGRVADAASATGHAYAIRFTVVGTTTTYDVIDTTTATTVASGQPYADGQAIAFDGVEVTVTGVPADGDEFTLAPSTRTNVFDIVQALADLLATPAPTGADRARVQQGLAAAIGNLDRAFERVLASRASVGARLQQADSVENANADHSVELQRRISEAQDLDYAKAVSDFARQQLALEAAQKSFAQITSRSLFDYL